MTKTQFTTFISHIIKARHYRGHGIHSPYLYSYVREVIIKKGDLCDLTIKKYPGKKIEITTDTEVALNSDAYISILKSPFKTKAEKKYWKTNRPSKKILTVHLPHYMVIFRDERVHNQHFMIRK